MNWEELRDLTGTLEENAGLLHELVTKRRLDTVRQLVGDIESACSEIIELAGLEEKEEEP